MSKKCIICNAEAAYVIKDISDYYCEDCAEESFGDIAVLIKVEDEAQRLKEFVKGRLAPQEAEHKMEQDEAKDLPNN